MPTQSGERGGLQGLDFKKFFPRFVVSNLGCKWVLVSTSHHCLVCTAISVKLGWRQKPRFPQKSLNTFTHLFPRAFLRVCLPPHTSDPSPGGSTLGRKRAGNLTLSCKLHKGRPSASRPSRVVSGKDAESKGENESLDCHVVVFRMT